MFDRYAIYYTATGGFASRGAAWLGWDVETGQSVVQPEVAGLDIAALTQAPQVYGFHGTLKAPFRVAQGHDQAGLLSAVSHLAGSLAPVQTDGLEVAALGRFLALVPTGDMTALRQLAATVVRELDGFRAPLSEEELARRRRSNLSAAQEDNLMRWGYPHVMEAFRFHLTLTGRMPKAEVAQVYAKLSAHFADCLPAPFVVDALTVVGQRAGRFETIERMPLLGAS